MAAVGDRFSCLEVVELLPSRQMPSGTKRLVRARCDCGQDMIVQVNNLRSGRSKQCKPCANRGWAPKRKRTDDQVNRRQLYKAYERGAIKRGLPFKLDALAFFEITEKPCNYCGAPPSNVYNLKKAGTQEPRAGVAFVYSGIDRVDSSKGYFVDNCVPACAVCNIAKSNMDAEEFKQWIARAYLHLKGNGDV